MGSGKKVTVGYRYFLGIHMVLCHGPIDRITQVTVADKIAFSGTWSLPSITINNPNLFGGLSREGGVAGQIDLLKGEPTQEPNSYLTSMLGGTGIPAFRGVTSVVLRHMYVGINPYLKPWAFRVQRIHVRSGGQAQWYDPKAPIPVLMPFTVDQSFVFALDVSGSMGLHRMKVARTAIQEVLWLIRSLMRISPGIRVDIGIILWSTPQFYRQMFRQDVTSSDISSLVAFVGTATAGGGTNFNDAATGILEWFTLSGHRTARRAGFFITDGLPTGDSANTAAATLADILNRSTGSFSYANNNPVDMYGINIIVQKTEETAKMDNTPEDGVPVVDDDNPDGLRNAVLGGIMGNVIALNPAHIVRECLTDRTWGMGYAEADIDDTSFRNAADTLFNERLGLCILWDQQTTIEDFLQLVLQHVDGVVRVNRTTGKFELKLVRDDYNTLDLPVLGPDNVSRVDGFSRPAFGELTNSVTVDFWNAGAASSGSLTVHDIALQQVQQESIGVTIQYPGLADADMAARVAARDLKALSTPLISATLYTQDVNIAEGDVFRFQWPDYEIGDVVMRVVTVAYSRDGIIKIVAAQDVFSSPSKSVLTPSFGEWTDPVSDANPIEYQTVGEVPYYEAVRQVGQSTFDGELALNSDLGVLFVAAARPPGGSIVNAVLNVDVGAGYEETGLIDFTPSAALSTPIDMFDTEVVLTSGFDLDNAVVPGYAQIGAGRDAEIVAVDGLSSNTLTFRRGCLDTTPKSHDQDTRVWFLSGFVQSDEVEYVSGETADIKVQPVSGRGPLSLAEVIPISITFATRAFRPYPPGKLQVDGEYYPEKWEGEDRVLSWAHRDRKAQTGAVLIDYTEDDVGPEDGINYYLTAQAIDFAGNGVGDPLIDDLDKETNTDHTLDTTPLVLPAGAVAVTIRVETERDAVRSWQAAEVIIPDECWPTQVSVPAFWLDVNDLSSLHQYSDGTVPVTVSDDPVGRITNQRGTNLWQSM